MSSNKISKRRRQKKLNELRAKEIAERMKRAVVAKLRPLCFQSKVGQCIVRTTCGDVVVSIDEQNKIVCIHKLNRRDLRMILDNNVYDIVSPKSELKLFVDLIDVARAQADTQTGS